MAKLGACVVTLFCAAAIAASAQTSFTTLVNFDTTNGFAPYFESLVQGLDGNLYGTTALGGGGTNNAGTAFEVTSTGSLTTVYNFCDHDPPRCVYQPTAGLILANNGNFYGTTTYGGDGDDGSVFEIMRDGMLATLHSFDLHDGANPAAPLVEASDGNLYGTTVSGGSGYECGTTRCGTVFKITPEGTFTTLHNFQLSDGAFPRAGLLQATDGNLYGTTSGGLVASSHGSIFRITLEGAFTTLYSFCAQRNCTDGASPQAALIQATDGGFYGTTGGGGIHDVGTVFRITSTGTLTTLYSFCAEVHCHDGEYPSAGLVQGTDGNFYGTTNGDGEGSVYGTIFRITPTGSLTTLHVFAPDVVDPYGTLAQATNGIFYGTTQQGGSNSAGTVYSLSVGLDSFVETLPTSRKPGSSVLILGNSLTGSTAVNFNGIAATFIVVSDTEITATVPAGATTGFLTVTTPSGTLKSNKPFRVIP